MSEAQRAARRQERIESLCAAAIRAIAGERDLHFRGRRLHRGARALPLYAPHLATSLEADDFASFRGAADGFGLRLRLSDDALHRRLEPADVVERMVFGLLEQFRCESRVPAGLPGVGTNLRHRFEAWTTAFHQGGGADTIRGLLLFAIVQMARSRVTGEPPAEAIEDAIETTRARIGPALGHDLVGLKRSRDDQAAYAVHALAIARTAAALLRDAAWTDAEETAAAKADDEDAWAAFALLLDPGEATDSGFATAPSGKSLVLDAAGRYRVFTRAYDRVVAAASLVRAEPLKAHRARLDERIAACGLHLAPLVRAWKALLARPAEDGWDGGQEAGRIDGRRLAQLIASPTERRLFRSERIEPRADCLVSLLIDCSGSMKAHAESVAVLVDLWVRALEQAGVACELLGFTTLAWNGGRAQRDWLRAGRPPHPGRLNESCQIVFKDAATPWRRARRSIAALLQPELFREGIDGEAVDWAIGRAAARDEARRLLIVISDGSPMDSATNLANDPHYLDQHLRDTVARHEAEGAEIYGVGVGLDLSPYYGRSHVLDLSASVTRATFHELIAMIARPARR